MRQPPQKPVVAAFDFDGTITTRNTLPLFFLHAAGKWHTFKKIFRRFPSLIGYTTRLTSRQEIKEIFLTDFFAGMSVCQLKELGESFARSKVMHQLIRPAAKRRIEWHKRQNHRCILVSASLDIFLHPWAKQAGFDHVICSELQVNATGHITGKLQGINCWGQEKRRRLEAFLGSKENFTLYAYGDSRGDKEMLAYADHAFYKKMHG